MLKKQLIPRPKPKAQQQKQTTIFSRCIIFGIFRDIILLYMTFSKTIFYPLLLLLIPLLGMFISDKVNWGIFDFIVSGGLLLLMSLGIHYSVQKVKNRKKQIVYISIIIFLVLLLWVELAVGLFGSPIAGN
ncbi:MAG: hypothetical protein ACO3SY_05895 [Flavobacteriaceae bacterium]